MRSTRSRNELRRSINCHDALYKRRNYLPLLLIVVNSRDILFLGRGRYRFWNTWQTPTSTKWKKKKTKTKTNKKKKKKKKTKKKKKKTATKQSPYKRHHESRQQAWRSDLYINTLLFLWPSNACSNTTVVKYRQCEVCPKSLLTAYAIALPVVEISLK